MLLALRCYRDAYSNRMPLQCIYRTLPVPFCSAMERSVASAEELLPVSEDCADILSVRLALSREGEEWRADLEILFRTKNGELARDYRSTVAAIEKMNEGELAPGRKLLIPRV